MGLAKNLKSASRKASGWYGLVIQPDYLWMW